MLYPHIVSRGDASLPSPRIYAHGCSYAYPLREHCRLACQSLSCGSSSVCQYYLYVRRHTSVFTIVLDEWNKASWRLAKRCRPTYAKHRLHGRPTISSVRVSKRYPPVQFLSASLYFSKRGAYWDRLCRDVVGWLVVGCHARALWPNGAS